MCPALPLLHNASFPVSSWHTYPLKPYCRDNRSQYLVAVYDCVLRNSHLLPAAHSWCFPLTCFVDSYKCSPHFGQVTTLACRVDLGRWCHSSIYVDAWELVGQAGAWRLLLVVLQTWSEPRLEHFGLWRLTNGIFRTECKLKPEDLVHINWVRVEDLDV